MLGSHYDTLLNRFLTFHGKSRFQGIKDGTYREVNRNWMDAQKYCKEMTEGALAGFNDEETRDFLFNYQTYDKKR